MLYYKELGTLIAHTSGLLIGCLIGSICLETTAGCPDTSTEGTSTTGTSAKGLVAGDTTFSYTNGNYYEAKITK